MASTDAAADAENGPDAFLSVKCVVGEVAPVFRDALALRKEVFMGEQAVTLEEEVDGRDPVSLHLVAYLDVVARAHYQRRQELSSRLAASSGLRVKFQPLSRAQPEGRYVPPPLEVAGTLRLRRVSSCDQLGQLNMMVTKLERLCVKKAFRRSGVGELLVRKAEEVARQAFHAPWILLHAQVQAKHFYERLGFVVWSDRVFMDANIAHVAMVKDLRAASPVPGRDAKL